MVEIGAIRKSNSPWASAVVLVRKKDGSLRFCIDLRHLHLNWCIIYLDDIIVFSETPGEHVKRLRGVFQKLAAAGLKLKPSKCEFFKKRIIYLGHVVSEKGIEVDPKKTEAVHKWPVPKTVTDVRSFLGFTNQYRKFIPKYAHVAGPLNELVQKRFQKEEKGGAMES